MSNSDTEPSFLSYDSDNDSDNESETYEELYDDEDVGLLYETLKLFPHLAHSSNILILLDIGKYRGTLQFLYHEQKRDIERLNCAESILKHQITIKHNMGELVESMQWMEELDRNQHHNRKLINGPISYKGADDYNDYYYGNIEKLNEHIKDQNKQLTNMTRYIDNTRDAINGLEMLAHSLL